jgi:hypothetical protein
MTRSEIHQKKTWKTFIQKNMFSLIFIVFMANIGLLMAVRYYGKANECFDKNSLASNSLCLYVYNGKVYEKGTHDEPHRGHPCGEDVTSILPASHLGEMASYLDPSYKGDICAAQPTATPEPTATPQPTEAPQPTDPPPPTDAPEPTEAPQPTDSPLPTNTPAPVHTSQPTPVPTLVKRANQCLVPPSVLNLHIDCPLCGN